MEDNINAFKIYLERFNIAFKKELFNNIKKVKKLL